MNILLARHPSPFMHGCALTIGNFDGVHLGHKHILQTLKAEAQARKLPAAALIFEPQPTEFFAHLQHNRYPLRLTPLRDKLNLLAATQCLDVVWIQRFNSVFASQSAEDFIEHNLIKNLRTKYLLIGDDFRFGQNRAGNFDLLSQQSAFITQRTASIQVEGIRASSTAIRQALQQGQLFKAKQILGHHYSLSGRVIHGAKLGRTLGCPTANIHLPRHHYALKGVFVVQVYSRLGMHNAVASLGTNPTVCDELETKLEVHLFDFNGNLYGERMKVTFLHKLRDEIKFNNIDELKQQIQIDMDNARNWLRNY